MLRTVGRSGLVGGGQWKLGWLGQQWAGYSRLGGGRAAYWPNIETKREAFDMDHFGTA